MARRERDEQRVIAVDISGKPARVDEQGELGIACAVLEHQRAAVAGIRGAGLSHEHLQLTLPREVVRVALELDTEGTVVDFRAIAQRLRDQDRLEAVGGVTAMSKLVNETPPLLDVEAHARRLMDVAAQREVGDVAAILAAESRTWLGPPQLWTERARSILGEAVEAASAARSVSIGDAMTRYMEKLAEIRAGRVEAWGIDCGLGEYNRLLGGLGLGQLHTIAALTGGGKSCLAQQIGLGVAGKMYNGERIGVVAVNGEMTHDEQVERAIAQTESITLEEIRSGQVELPLGRLDPVEAARRRFADMPIEMFAARTDFAGIRALCRRAQAKWDRARRPGEPRTRLMVLEVDYLQIMKFNEEASRRDLAVQDFTSALKDWSMHELVHSIVLSQFKRDDAIKGGREPTVWDLKESGAIENDSDRITIIDRPNDQVPEALRDADLDDFSRFRLAKARGRKKGSCPMTFWGEFYLFTEPTEDQRSRWRSARERGEDRDCGPTPARSSGSRWGPKKGFPKPPARPGETTTNDTNTSNGRGASR